MLRFALARARAAAAPLIALAVVAAISSLLILGMMTMIASVETGEARRALAGSTEAASRAVLSLGSPTLADEGAAAAQAALVDSPSAGALRVGVDDGDVIITLDLTTVTSTHLAALDAELDRLRDAIQEKTGERPAETGGLRATTESILDGIEARRGPTAVATSLLGMLTAVVIGAVALEPVRARESESRLLRARGARRRDLASIAGLEAGSVSLVGALAGALVAVATALGAGAGAAVGVPVALVVAVAIAVTAGAVAAISTARGAERGASRARTVADAGLLVVAATITGLGIWRFVQSGDPLVTRGDGTKALDPLVTIAPALTLVLAALLAVGIATPVARAAAAAFAPARGVSPVTPLRLSSRRPARHALPIVVVAFAIGTTTLAGAYDASLSALGTGPEAIRTGADVRVTTIPEDLAAADVAASGAPDAVMLVRSLSAQGADERIPVLAVQAARIPDVMLDAGGVIDRDAIADALRFSGSGVPLTGDALAVKIVAVPADPVDGGEASELPPPALSGEVTIASDDGTIEALPFTNADVSVVDDGGQVTVDADVRAEETVTLPLPPGTDWSLVAVGVGYHPAGYSAPGRGEITATTSGGTDVDLSGFRPTAGTPGSVEGAGSGLVFTPASGAGQPLTQAVAPDVAAAVPAVMTSALAASLGLEVGDTLALEIVKPAFAADFEITAIVPVIPGSTTGEGMLVDLGRLSIASPERIVPTQAWLATDDPAGVATAIGEEFPQTVTLVRDPRSALNAEGTVYAFAMAAAGAVVLAVVVLILRRTRGRADSRELALFAVMGLGRHRASRLRAQEDLIAVAMGALGGVAAGVATAWLVVAPLVRAAYGDVPDAYPIELRADPLPLSVAILVSVAVFSAVIVTVRTPTRLAPLMREDE